jgi:putative transcriptional regulator
MVLFHLDMMLLREKMSLTELSDQVGITIANLSILKTGKARAVRMDTLNKLCAALHCQPGDLMEYQED